MIRLPRRHVLLVGVVVAVVLAGCAGGSGTPTATDVDGASDGDDGASDGASDGGGDGASDGASDGDDGEATATPAPTATASPTSTASPTPTATTATPLPTLGDLLQVEDSYRYRFDIDQVDGESVDFVQEGRWRDGNLYARITSQGESVEVYLVDGQQYFVADGECVDLQRAPQRDPANWTGREAFGNLSLRPVDTTTIDGEDVYVYESEADRPGGLEGPFTIYVSTETGYVLRQESPNVVSETWDWGNVEPIQPPC